MLAYPFGSHWGNLRHVGVLQGGSDVEEIETSKYRWFHRCLAKPFAICIGVDAERHSDRVSG